MTLHRAAWLLPIASPPIRDGWVAVERGRIIAAGGPSDLPSGGGRAAAAGTEVILPGLVNAHTHLELSWMRGQVPPAPVMPAWAARTIARRRMVQDEPREPMAEAVAALDACGTSLVGEVTNTLAAYGALRESALSACVFLELIGFAAGDGEAVVARARAALDALEPCDRLRPSIVPHAPYSVSPALFRAIARGSQGPVVTVHLAESREEIEFLRDGTGAWRELLEGLGAWNGAWTPPGCGPVAYLERFGLIDGRLLAVHGVQLTDAELGELARAGATVVTCPRSNRWTGAGDPPIARFYASGVRVAIGTDSLASVENLSLFAEMAAVRALAPAVPAARIVESGTRSGADALGFGPALGTIEPGKRARMLAVRIPPDVGDVEEYLVSGVVRPGDIRWLSPD